MRNFWDVIFNFGCLDTLDLLRPLLVQFVYRGKRVVVPLYNYCLRYEFHAYSDRIKVAPSFNTNLYRPRVKRKRSHKSFAYNVHPGRAIEGNWPIEESSMESLNHITGSY